MYSLSARETFPVAARQWLKGHSVYIRKSTHKGYLQNIQTLEKFLEEIPLCNITNGTIAAFQNWRSLTAGATRINIEVGCLQLILKSAGLWKKLKDNYKALPGSKTKVRQVMNNQQLRRFFEVCFLKPKRLLAAHCLIVMMFTSMGFGELRRLRREDVRLDFEPPYVSVQGDTKNDYRIRTVTLNRLALRSMRWIVRRWESLGGTKPEQFILPHRAKKRGGPVLFDEPMGHIYRAARGILKDADLAHLDPYDMRSQFITDVLEDPECSEQMYTELVGHSPKGKQMRMRYSRQRLEKKAAITDKLCDPSRGIEPERAGFTVIAGGKQA